MGLNKISFFDPVLPGNSLSIGSYGEWFFNFNCKKVYQIRTDDLRSNEGTEVICKNINKNEKQNIILRVILIICIVPAFIALVDKIFFRLAHMQLHINPLTDQWRKDQAGLMHGKIMISSGFCSKKYFPSIEQYPKNSIFLYVSQEHPWLFPKIQIAEITKDRNLLTHISGVWSHKEEGFYIASYNAYYYEPEILINKYLTISGNENYIVAQKIVPCLVPDDVQNYSQYRGEFESIEGYQSMMLNRQNNDLFYSHANNCFILDTKSTLLAIKYENGLYVVGIQNRFLKDKNLVALIDEVDSIIPSSSW